MRRIWISSAVLTAALFALTLVSDSQSGQCFDGDPIPDCPDASTLYDLGYVLGTLTLLCGTVWLVTTLMVLWRARKKQRRHGY